MIKVNIVCVGKIKESFYRDAVAEYAKRLSRFCRFEVKELAEGRASGRAEGAKEATISNARAMLAGGIPSDRVADILKLSESDMKEVMNMR